MELRMMYMIPPLLLSSQRPCAVGEDERDWLGQGQMSGQWNMNLHQVKTSVLSSPWGIFCRVCNATVTTSSEYFKTVREWQWGHTSSSFRDWHWAPLGIPTAHQWAAGTTRKWSPRGWALGIPASIRHQALPGTQHQWATLGSLWATSEQHWALAFAVKFSWLVCTFYCFVPVKISLEKFLSLNPDLEHVDLIFKVS